MFLIIISETDLCHFEASAATKKLEMGVANEVILWLGDAMKFWKVMLLLPDE